MVRLEDTMSTKFAAVSLRMSARSTGTGLYNYSKNGQTFIDLNSVSEYLDLTQWDEAKLAACTWQTLSSAYPCL